MLPISPVARAQDAKPAADAALDVLVLSNGDTLHGKLVKEIGGKVTFHTDSLGDLDVAWDKIKELHAAGSYGVLAKGVKLHGRKNEGPLPMGTVDVENQAVAVHPASAAAAPAPIPVNDAEFIIDQPTLDKQMHHEPGFFSGWNGAATAGATLVEATQNQYTVSGGIGLVRAVPSVSWLNARNRTQFDFTGSFGKITQPGTTPTKSAIYQLDAERDEYFTSRVFALAQAAWNHNFAQDLQLQQIYGGGLGVTLLKTPKQEADAKATVQYEKQSFIGGTESNQNLIGSTFALNYAAKARLFTYAQQLAFIPAYNTPSAYSAGETDTLAFPTYKNFAFSVGTIDTYLNDAPLGTRRNSFQFTMGLTYAIKSKY
ncbi:MAG TPA: DUF481 domain-containing protein [Terracidiphilus sp.]|nr:DUF481 domain-containing protein [Terracidiphilus sp.]